MKKKNNRIRNNMVGEAIAENKDRMLWMKSVKC